MNTRRAAIRTVGALVLLSVACAKTVEGRRNAIYELKADPNPENVDRIRAALDDEHYGVRATALHALVELGVSDAKELAVEGLADPDSFVRKTAAHALKDLGDGAAVAALSDRLAEDEDYVVRQKAAAALAAIGNDEALAGLMVALEDPVKEVRLAAVRGVAKVDPDVAIDPLVLIVLQDPDWEIRVQAAAALGTSASEDVIIP